MATINVAKRKVVVFSGGSAANSLVDVFNEVIEKNNCALTYVIPISDNGGSSSEILRVFGGPGIGDVRSRFVFIYVLFCISFLSLFPFLPFLKMRFWGLPSIQFTYADLSFKNTATDPPFRQVVSSASSHQHMPPFETSSTTAFPPPQSRQPASSSLS